MLSWKFLVCCCVAQILRFSEGSALKIRANMQCSIVPVLCKFYPPSPAGRCLSVCCVYHVSPLHHLQFIGVTCAWMPLWDDRDAREPTLLQRGAFLKAPFDYPDPVRCKLLITLASHSNCTAIPHSFVHQLFTGLPPSCLVWPWPDHSPPVGWLLQSVLADHFSFWSPTALAMLRVTCSVGNEFLFRLHCAYSVESWERTGIFSFSPWWNQNSIQFSMYLEILVVKLLLFLCSMSLKSVFSRLFKWSSLVP